jgi:hypothetical protein
MARQLTSQPSMSVEARRTLREPTTPAANGYLSTWQGGI